MQIHRLFEIVYLLLNGKTMTARELAEHFEVSVRTILRDVDTLSAAHIPIFAARGKGGGISIMDSFVLNKAVLTGEEQHQILLALQSLSAAGHPDGRSALKKLAALFETSPADWIEVDFSRWGHAGSDRERFLLIKQVIVSRTAIRFEYVGSNGESSERTAYPLKLVFKSKAWYLQGFCLVRQDYRTFRINRMLNIRMTQERFDNRLFSAPSIEEGQPSMESLVLLELEFPKHVSYRVYDEFDESCIEKGDGGSLRVVARLPEDNWLYGFLMSFGPDVNVIRPPHVKERFAKKISKT